MTKKDYELIARRLKLEFESWREQSGPVFGTEAQRAIWLVIDGFVRDFERTNPRFDRDKFLQACGIKEQHIHTKGTLCPIEDCCL